LNFNYLFFLLFPVFLFSQNTIRVTVVDENNLPVSRAIVLLSQNEIQIGFGTTNQDGLLQRQIASGQYEIKISKLGFASLYDTIVVGVNKYFQFVLKEAVNKLENVVITSRPKLMRIKEDTISYNLRAIVDGTENKIEDVIKKLPGLEVDSDGKVLYKGVKIENVLVDGNEFFGSKHQMATQNIDADMIEGIDLLTNYSGFAIASGGSKGVALNLKTKDSYKNKWVADLEVASGLNNSFRFHSNSFKFFKKGNLAILTDYNTIAKTPISRDDYKEVRAVSEVDNDNGEFKEVEIPSFLNSNSFIKEKKNAFVGLNYTSLLSPRSKVTFSNIFNKTNIAELNNKTQTNIGETTNKISFFENKQASYYLNNTSLKWEFNKSKTTFISYLAGFTPNSDNDNQDLLRLVNRINYSKEHTNRSFAQAFRVQTKLFNAIDYKMLVRHTTDSEKQSLDLFSQEKLFNSSSDSINQKTKNWERSLSFYNLFSMTKSSSVFSLKLNLVTHNANTTNSIFQNPQYNANVKLQYQSIQSNFSWLKNWDAKFQSVVGVNFTNSNSQFQASHNTFSRFEPNLSLIYNFSGFNKLSFNYVLEHQLPTIYQVQESSLVYDFQTILRPSLVDYSVILPKNTYSLQYLSINSKNYSVLFSSLSYVMEQNSISNNTNYTSDFIENQMIYTKGSEALKGLIMYDLKFRRLPLSIKTTLFYLKSKGVSQFNGLDNNFVSKNLTGRMQLISNLKKSNVQFGVDYNYIQRNIKQSVNDFSNTTQNHQLSLSLRGKIRSMLKWDTGFTIDKQDSNFNTNKVFLLNANIQYNLTKDVKLILNGNNILNLDNSQIISTSFNQSFFTESVALIMPGYVMIGLNYSL
jgi:hypothetical protein